MVLPGPIPGMLKTRFGNNVAERLKITLLVPTLNEVEASPLTMPTIQPSWVDEIIVIDGGSTDGTIEYMQSAGYRVYSQANRGYGKGVLEGATLAKGEIIIEFTPDGNTVAEKIPALINKIEEGYDLVIGSRYLGPAHSDDDDWLTALGNHLFTAMVNILFRTRYTDVLVAFRAYRRSKLLELSMDASSLNWPCQTSIRFAKAGFRVTEIPADEPKRLGGIRKMMPLRTGWEILMMILRDWLFWRPVKKASSP